MASEPNVHLAREAIERIEDRLGAHVDGDPDLGFVETIFEMLVFRVRELERINQEAISISSAFLGWIGNEMSYADSDDELAMRGFVKSIQAALKGGGDVGGKSK